MAAAGVGIWAPGENPGTHEEALAAVKLALEVGGGEVNDVDKDGETALHGAVYRGGAMPVDPVPDRQGRQARRGEQEGLDAADRRPTASSTRPPCSSAIPKPRRCCARRCASGACPCRARPARQRRSAEAQQRPCACSPEQRCCRGAGRPHEAEQRSRDGMRLHRGAGRPRAKPSTRSRARACHAEDLLGDAAHRRSSARRSSIASVAPPSRYGEDDPGTDAAGGARQPGHAGLRRHRRAIC